MDITSYQSTPLEEQSIVLELIQRVNDSEPPTHILTEYEHIAREFLVEHPTDPGGCYYLKQVISMGIYSGSAIFTDHILAELVELMRIDHRYLYSLTTVRRFLQMCQLHRPTIARDALILAIGDAMLNFMQENFASI